MKLYAQHGNGEAEKIRTGLNQNILDGVIFSPKDMSEINLDQKLAEFSAIDSHPDLLFDPQFYACFLSGAPNVRLGHLVESYSCYFGSRRRANLEREDAVRENLRQTMVMQVAKPSLSAIIAPNVLIRRSLDSREASISSNFIRLAREVYDDCSDRRPLYATLALSREAVLNRNELLEFVDEITGLDSPPDGFYILMSGRSSDARTEIFNADVIAAWMYINHSLAVNGFKVINGYSDIVTPFLGACGGSAGATGWWSNLRTFSMDRFEPSREGGRQPIPRYLSTKLINRITHFELDQLRTLRLANSRIPEVLNGLPTDSLYDPADNSEPQRAVEVMQSWDAIKALNTRLNGETPKRNRFEKLQESLRAIQEAEEAYLQIPPSIELDIKSNGDHLESLREGIYEFSEMAELGLPR
jgi:hypothetical protein